MAFRFEELTVYQRALDVVDAIYVIARQFPSDELYALASQFRRAAISIVLNIAEGHGRTKKDFSHFLDIARTSAYECVACLTIALRQRYIMEAQYNKIYQALVEIIKMINGLKQSILRTNN